MTDAVERALRDVAAALAWPADDGAVTVRAMTRLDRAPRRRRRWWAPAAVAASAVAVAMPAAAGLLGVPGIRIVREAGPLPDGVGTALHLGRSVDVPADAPVVPGAGAPMAAYADDGIVTYVWAPSTTLPEVLDTGVGLLFTTISGTVDETLIEKQVFDGATVEATTVDGEPAWFVSGAPHALLFLDPGGEVRELPIRRSGSALVWSIDGTSHRLESALPLERARALAASLS